MRVGRCAWRVLHSAFLFLCSVFLAEFFASSRLRGFLGAVLREFARHSTQVMALF